MNFRIILLLLFKMLKLHRGEEKKLLLFGAVNLITSMMIGIMNNGVDAIVLNFFGNADPIPMLLIFGSLLLIVASVLYGTYADRYNGTWIIILTLGASSLFFILFSSLFDYLPDWNIKYYTLYVFRFTLSTVLTLQFWEICNLFFDIRQGKRLFPKIMLIGSIGYAAGSFIIAGLAGYLSQVRILWFIAFSCLLSTVITFQLAKLPVSFHIRRKKSSPVQEIREGFASMEYNPFLKIFSLSTFLFGISAGLILYTYNDIVANLFQDSFNLASFLGVWRGLAEVVIYIFQAVLVMKVMSISEMGSSFQKGILIRLLGFQLMLLFFVFSMTASADFSRQLLLALMSPGAVLAFSVLPREIRSKAMAFNNGFVSSAGVIIGGAILVPVIRPLQAFLGQKGMYVVLIATILILILWRLILNIKINKEYLKTLSGNMTRGKMDLSLVANNIENIATNKELFGKLIEDFDHLDSSIKLYLLNTLQPYLTEAEQGDLLMSRFDKEKDSVKYKIIEILGLIKGDHLVSRIDDLILSDDRQIRTETIIYRHRKCAEGEKAFDTCGELISLKDGEIQDKISAMQIIERMQLKEYIPELINALDGEDEQVVKQALNTLVSLKAEDAIPLFIPKLFDNKYSRHFNRAIEGFGPSAAEPVIDYYSRLDRADFEKRRKLIRVIGKVYKLSSINFLNDELNGLIGSDAYPTDIVKMSRDSRVKYNCSVEEETLIDEIVTVLSNYPAESLAPEYSTVLTYVINNAQRTYHAALNKEKIEKEGRDKYSLLVCKLLDEDILMGLKRMMRAVILLSGNFEHQKTLSKAMRLIHSENRRLRSQAFELFETLGDKKITAYILPYLENLSFAELKIRMGRHFPFLGPDTEVMFGEWRHLNESVFNMKWKKNLAELVPGT
ncbi:hypothetical protein ACFL6W_09750 [Thermodesulfobacteriota bacterium]